MRAPSHRPEHPDAPRGVAATLLRSARLTLVIFGVLVAAIVLAVWLGGDALTLPFDYDGF